MSSESDCNYPDDDEKLKANVQRDFDEMEHTFQKQAANLQTLRDEIDDRDKGNATDEVELDGEGNGTDENDELDDGNVGNTKETDGQADGQETESLNSMMTDDTPDYQPGEPILVQRPGPATWHHATFNKAKVANGTVKAMEVTVTHMDGVKQVVTVEPSTTMPPADYTGPAYSTFPRSLYDQAWGRKHGFQALYGDKYMNDNNLWTLEHAFKPTDGLQYDTDPEEYEQDTENGNGQIEDEGDGRNGQDDEETGGEQTDRTPTQRRKEEKKSPEATFTQPSIIAAMQTAREKPKKTKRLMEPQPPVGTKENEIGAQKTPPTTPTKERLNTKKQTQTTPKLPAGSVPLGKRAFRFQGEKHIYRGPPPSIEYQDDDILELEDQGEDLQLQRTPTPRPTPQSASKKRNNNSPHLVNEVYRLQKTSTPVKTPPPAKRVTFNNFSPIMGMQTLETPPRMERTQSGDHLPTPRNLKLKIENINDKLRLIEGTLNSFDMITEEERRKPHNSEQIMTIAKQQIALTKERERVKAALDEYEMYRRMEEEDRTSNSNTMTEALTGAVNNMTKVVQQFTTNNDNKERKCPAAGCNHVANSKEELLQHQEICVEYIDDHQRAQVTKNKNIPIKEHNNPVESMVDNMRDKLSPARFLPCPTDADEMYKAFPIKVKPLRTNYRQDELGIQMYQLGPLIAIHDAGDTKIELKNYASVNIHAKTLERQLKPVASGLKEDPTFKEVRNTAEALRAFLTYALLNNRVHPGDDSPLAAFAFLFDKMVLGRHKPSKEAVAQYFANFIHERANAFASGKVPPFYEKCQKIWDNLINQFRISGETFYEGKNNMLPYQDDHEPAYKKRKFDDNHGRGGQGNNNYNRGGARGRGNFHNTHKPRRYGQPLKKNVGYCYLYNQGKECNRENNYGLDNNGRCRSSKGDTYAHKCSKKKNGVICNGDHRESECQ